MLASCHLSQGITPHSCMREHGSRLILLVQVQRNVDGNGGGEDAGSLDRERPANRFTHMYVLVLYMMTSGTARRCLSVCSVVDRNLPSLRYTNRNQKHQRSKHPAASLLNQAR